MASPVKRVPEGNHTVSPHLTVRDGEKMIDFYTRAFGAKLIRKSMTPDGKLLLHAELQFGDSKVFLNDEFPQMNAACPLVRGGTSVVIHLYVEDVDSLYTQATIAGAKVVMPLADQFWGDRYAVVEDPVGHHWSMASHVKDMTPDEMRKAMEAMSGDHCNS